MTEAKKKRLREKQIELLKMFEGDFYQEKKVEDQFGEQWYIKSFNGGTQRWQVSVFSAASYKKYKSFQAEKEPNRRKENIKPMVPFKRPTLESVKKLVNKNGKRSRIIMVLQ